MNNIWQDMKTILWDEIWDEIWADMLNPIKEKVEKIDVIIYFSDVFLGCVYAPIDDAIQSNWEE